MSLFSSIVVLSDTIWGSLGVKRSLIYPPSAAQSQVTSGSWKRSALSVLSFYFLLFCTQFPLVERVFSRISRPMGGANTTNVSRLINTTENSLIAIFLVSKMCSNIKEQVFCNISKIYSIYIIACQPQGLGMRWNLGGRWGLKSG